MIGLPCPTHQASLVAIACEPFLIVTAVKLDEDCANCSVIVPGVAPFNTQAWTRATVSVLLQKPVTRSAIRPEEVLLLLIVFPAVPPTTSSVAFIVAPLGTVRPVFSPVVESAAPMSR